MKTIVIDPGHGGYDSGATGNGYKEKDVVLKMALRVGKVLERHGLKVIYTRTTDRFVSLSERANIANKATADYFLSLHLNSYHLSSANGTETFHFPGSNQSKTTGRAFHDEVMKSVKLTNRGLKSGNLSVLRNTSMRANLFEACFISNKKDIDYLMNNFTLLINSIAQGVCKALGVKFKPETKPTPPKQLPKPTTPVVIDGKVTLRLASEYINIDGFKLDGHNYIKVDDKYLKIRDTLEALGFIVGWDNKNKVVTGDLSKGYKATGSKVDIVFLGNHITVAAKNIKDSWSIKLEDKYYSIRSIFEAMGLKVEWNKKGSKILVNK